MEMLRVLKEVGCDTVLAATRRYSDTDWTREAREHVLERFVEDVVIYETTWTDDLFMKGLRGWEYLTGAERQFNSRYYNPPGMRRWFFRLVESVDPDVIWMNYLRWTPLIDCRSSKGRLKVVDIHDFLSLSDKMRGVLRKHWTVQQNGSISISEEALEESFYEQRHLQPSQEELSAVDHYDYAFTLSETQNRIVDAESSRTQALHVPVTHPVVEGKSKSREVALMVASDNPFNVQGYQYFIQKVLPIVMHKIPDFHLEVAGNIKDLVSGDVPDGVELRGFVEDIGEFYSRGCVAVCPTFGGTGQQVKVVEAMAHGVPVTTLANATNVSSVIADETGFVCRDADEFAEAIIRLWNHPECVEKMGRNARQHVADTFSTRAVKKKLTDVFECHKV